MVLARVNHTVGVRQSPNMDAAYMGSIPAGSNILTYEKRPDATAAKHWWYRVKLNGQNGWVTGFRHRGWWGSVYVAEYLKESVADGYLLQRLWRSNQGYWRTVPTVGSRARWESASPWSILSWGLPGGGGYVQAKTAYVIGQTFTEEFFINDYFWRRTVPISRTGTLEWYNHSVWSGPFGLHNKPGGGSIQSYDTFTVGNTFWEAFWRSNKGWYRTVPIYNGEIDLDYPYPWHGPIALSDIPGQWGMQAQSAIAVGNILTQSFWRGNQGWYRTVPIYNGRPQWGDPSASDWSGPLSLSMLPGSGAIQGLDGVHIKTDSY